MSTANEVVFKLPNGEVCPIHLKDIEVEDAIYSPLDIRLGVGTRFIHKGSRYEVSKIFTSLNMDDIIASIGTTGQSAKVHVHYTIERIGDV